MVAAAALLGIEGQLPHGAIVFVSSVARCELLFLGLKYSGLPVVRLHSLLPQKDRSAALQAFRALRQPFLVTTDVCGRGLDLPVAKLVVNMDLPHTPGEYVHRVGRTARAGHAGLAVSLIAPNDVPRLHTIEHATGIRLKRLKVPEHTVLRLLKPVHDALARAQADLNTQGFFERWTLRQKLDAQPRFP